MIIKKIKNNTLTDKTYNGQVIAPGEYYQLSVEEFHVFMADMQLLADIDAGDIIVNDGNSDLSADEGRRRIVTRLPVVETSETSTFSTTSTTPVLLPGFSKVVPAGTYYMAWSGSIKMYEKQQMGMVALFKGGVKMDSTARHGHDISGHTHLARLVVHTHCICEMDGTEACEIRVWSNTASGMDVFESSWEIIQIG